MTARPLDRRRLLAGGGAAAGLAVLGACAQPGAPEGPTAAATITTPVQPTATASLPVSPSVAPSPTPTTVRRAEAPKLADRLDDYLDGRTGDLGLELVDLRRGQSFRWDAEEGHCHSTIKVLILTTLLYLLQENDEPLSRGQRTLAEQMITRSDNVATEALLAEVGRPEVRRVGDLVGMHDTHLDDGWWGLWRTTPGDLNRMVGAVLSSDAVLDGYRLSSAGWVTAHDREYQLAILSNSPGGYGHGRRTLSEVAGICHQAMAHGLA